MSPVVHLVRAATGLLLLAAFVVLALAVGARAAGYSASPVLTGSMRPTYNPGDLVVTRPQDSRELRSGQVAVFVPPGQTSSFAHRIVSISGTPGNPVLRTQGDANPSPDSWRARINTPTVPVVVTHIPFAGRLAVLLHGPNTRALLTALLGLALTAVSVRIVITPLPAPTPVS